MILLNVSALHKFSSLPIYSNIDSPIKCKYQFIFIINYVYDYVFFMLCIVRNEHSLELSCVKSEYIRISGVNLHIKYNGTFDIVYFYCAYELDGYLII